MHNYTHNQNNFNEMIQNGFDWALDKYIYPCTIKGRTKLDNYGIFIVEIQKQIFNVDICCNSTFDFLSHFIYQMT